MMGKWQSNGVRLAARLMMAFAGALLALTAHAQPACSYARNNAYGSAPFDAILPLNAALTIASVVPNGTILYKHGVGTKGQMGVECREETWITESVSFPVTPKPLSSWNSGWLAGKVYQTGVPGIGVVFHDRSGSVVPWARPSNSPSIGTSIGGAGSPLIYMSLIKIGTVSPGTISGSNLPTMQFDYTYPGNSVTMMRLRFSGSIQIVAGTCMTPNVSVPLGEHETKVFKGKGTGTPWKRFNIVLQNCPAFHAASAWQDVNDTANGWVTDPLQTGVRLNSVRLSLTPTTGAVGEFTGVTRPAPTTSGAAAARGVGIEIQRDDGSPIDFYRSWDSGATLTAVDGEIYRIPLRARYLQVGDRTPTAGPANASVMFTINYQ